MIKCLLVEDDEISSEIIQSLLLTNFGGLFSLVGVAGNLDEALKMIHNQQPDLVFLDIHLPGKNGFDFLEAIPSRNFDIIITTGDPLQASDAFKYNSLDYLLKPITKEALIRSVNKFLEKKYFSNSNERSQKIKLPTAHGILFLTPSEISYCEAEVNYTKIYLTDGTHSVILKSMKDLELMLKYSGFFRVQKSYIINVNHLKEYSRSEGGFAIMSGFTQTKVPVSKQVKDDFEKILNLSR